jgi:hypothetical protein
MPSAHREICLPGNLPAGRSAYREICLPGDLLVGKSAHQELMAEKQEKQLGQSESVRC